MKKQKPIILLDHPQMGENIGAVARAMMNCELEELRLVAPRDGWPNEKAWPMASGADAILENVKVYETFEAAIADVHHVYAMTARSRDMNKPSYSPKQLMQEILPTFSEDTKVIFAFGAERSGLSNDDVARSTAIIEVPLNPGFSSLNLAQAVLIAAYEYYQTDVVPAAIDDQNSPATQDKYQNFFEHLELELDDRGFFTVAEKKARMMRNIETMFLRANCSESELQTLHGIIASIAGRRKHEI